MSRSIGAFRPRLVPTLVTLPIVLLCLGLGAWQMQRLQWKEGLIAQRAAAPMAPEVAPPRTPAEAGALEFRRVVDDGVFLPDKRVLLHAIGPQGEAGFDVLTPLREAGSRIVLVNRGFVPAGEIGRAAPPPDGESRVTGRLRLPPPRKPGWFLPDNDPGRREWFWIDLPAIAAAAGLRPVAPFYIDADATPNPGGWPNGGAPLPALPNNHLQYALTWFSLAVAAGVIYVMSQRNSGAADARDDQRLPRA